MGQDYTIGGVDALEIGTEFETPLYVYDSEKIKKKYQELTNAFSTIDHRIHYACKANEATEILRMFKSMGSGVDTVSPNEIKRAIKVGFSPEDIIFTPSCPGFEEIEFAMERNIVIHFGGIEYLEMLGSKLENKKIGIRLNPDVPISGNQKIATAHANSKFGVPLNQMDRLHNLVDKHNIEVKTLHIHTGSDVKSWKDLAKSFDALIGQAPGFKNLESLDIGSGLKVKYGPEDKQIDLKEYAAYIEKRLKEMKRQLKIIIEPGKFLVAEAGYLLARVNVVKQGYTKKFVGLNTGFHHLIRPMYYDAYHHIVNISNMNDVEERYDVVGQLCEEDTFAMDRALSKVTQGDILCFENVGAYAYSMSSIYNLREKPTQLLVKGGRLINISERKIKI